MCVCVRVCERESARTHVLYCESFHFKMHADCITFAVGSNNARQDSVPERNETGCCRNTYILIVSGNQCFCISIVRMLAEVSTSYSL
jgi:hypothetical protein